MKWTWLEELLPNTNRLVIFYYIRARAIQAIPNICTSPNTRKQTCIPLVKPWSTSIFQNTVYIKVTRLTSVLSWPAKGSAVTHQTDDLGIKFLLSNVIIQCHFNTGALCHLVLRSSLWQHCFTALTTFQFCLTHLWPRTCNSTLFFSLRCLENIKRIRDIRNIKFRGPC